VESKGQENTKSVSLITSICWFIFIHGVLQLYQDPLKWKTNFVLVSQKTFHKFFIIFGGISNHAHGSDSRSKGNRDMAMVSCLISSESTSSRHGKSTQLDIAIASKLASIVAMVSTADPLSISSIYGCC